MSEALLIFIITHLLLSLIIIIVIIFIVIYNCMFQQMLGVNVRGKTNHLQDKLTEV